MRAWVFSLLVVCILPMLGCSPLEEQARDAAAALSGSIVAAQTKYQTTCAANPGQEICQLINRGVSGQNALITAIETYCSWALTLDPSGPKAGPPGAPTLAPPDPAAKCVPVRSAEPALRIAIANAATLTLQIKGAI